MADTPPTGDQPPAGTPGTPPASTPPAPEPGKETPGATPPKGGAPATNEDGTVTLSAQDYKNLVSQRDKANNAAKSNEGQEAFIEQMAQERAIKDFLKTNKKDYPDLTSADLAHIWDPEQLKPEADRLQRRLQDHAQSKLESIENTPVPVLSPQQRKEQEDQLKKNKPSDAFEQMVNLRMPA